MFFNLVPDDYEDQLKYYTHHGYRVLAVAWKKMESIQYSALQKLKRGSVESRLQFLGFIVFENKLKPGTTPVIQTLSKACIRQVMCTGDNPLTAISVSRECGLVDPQKAIYVPKFVKGESHEEDAVIEWENVDEPDLKIDSVTLLVLFNLCSPSHFLVVPKLVPEELNPLITSWPLREMCSNGC